MYNCSHCLQQLHLSLSSQPPKFFPTLAFQPLLNHSSFMNHFMCLNIRIRDVLSMDSKSLGCDLVGTTVGMRNSRSHGTRNSWITDDVSWYDSLASSSSNSVNFSNYAMRHGIICIKFVLVLPLVTLLDVELDQVVQGIWYLH